MRHNFIVITAYLVWFRPFCLHPHWLLISCPSTYSVAWCPLCVMPHRLAHGIVRVSLAWLMAPSSFRRRSLSTRLHFLSAWPTTPLICSVLLWVTVPTSLYASQCARLEAPSACMCSCRLQCTATQALGLQCMRRAGRGRRSLFVCLAACSARGTVCLYVQLSAPVHS